MRKISTLSAVLVVAVFVLNGYITQASNQDKFWTEAAQGGMAEVKLSQMALQKSQNAEVRAFAQRMVDDHTKANDELKVLAMSRNVMIPTDVNAKQAAIINKLSGMSGMNFDKEYMKTMVKDHEKMVMLFERQSETGVDADVKAFATQTLPTLRSHLEMARTMNGSMKNKSRNKNMNDNRYSDKTPNVNSDSMMNSDKRDSDRNMNSNRNTNSNQN